MTRSFGATRLWALVATLAAWLERCYHLFIGEMVTDSCGPFVTVGVLCFHQASSVVLVGESGCGLLVLFFSFFLTFNPFCFISAGFGGFIIVKY